MQLLDAGPARGAFLDPGHVSRGARRQAGLVNHSLESLLRGGYLGEYLVAARAVVEPTDDTDAIVIIDGQNDILGHGGLRCKNLLGPAARTSERQPGLLQASLIDLRGRPPLLMPSTMSPFSPPRKDASGSISFPRRRSRTSGRWVRMSVT